jgi:2-dehydro-3-deoxyphosphogalactonate aldolase
MQFSNRFTLPLIVILRGLTAHDAASVGTILFEAGFPMLEVPLNRPGALDSIRELRRMAPDTALVGGGAVLTAHDVDAVFNAGGQFVGMPNTDADIIRHVVHSPMLALPGCTTPTEGFRALAAGADALKLFPAEMITPAVLNAWVAVFPPQTALLPVGGIHPGNMAAYVDAGAGGFGIGTQLYRPGVELATLARAAEAFMALRNALIAGTQ